MTRSLPSVDSGNIVTSWLVCLMWEPTCFVSSVWIWKWFCWPRWVYGHVGSFLLTCLRVYWHVWKFCDKLCLGLRFVLGCLICLGLGFRSRCRILISEFIWVWNLRIWLVIGFDLDGRARTDRVKGNEAEIWSFEERVIEVKLDYLFFRRFDKCKYLGEREKQDIVGSHRAFCRTISGKCGDISQLLTKGIILFMCIYVLIIIKSRKSPKRYKHWRLRLRPLFMENFSWVFTLRFKR